MWGGSAALGYSQAPMPTELLTSAIMPTPMDAVLASESCRPNHQVYARASSPKAVNRSPNIVEDTQEHIPVTSMAREVLEMEHCAEELPPMPYFSAADDGDSIVRGEEAAPLRELERQRRALAAEVETRRREVSRLTNENNRSARTIEQLQSRSVRALERQDIGAQTFGTKANLISSADVRRIMEDLNSEIFQLAVSLSEFRSRTRRGTGTGAGGQATTSEPRNRMTDILGNKLVELLLDDGISSIERTMLLQIALQATNNGLEPSEDWSLGSDQRQRRMEHDSRQIVYRHLSFS
jgi:hypothetical protein